MIPTFIHRAKGSAMSLPDGPAPPPESGTRQESGLGAGRNPVAEAAAEPTTRLDDASSRPHDHNQVSPTPPSGGGWFVRCGRTVVLQLGVFVVGTLIRETVAVV